MNQVMPIVFFQITSQDFADFDKHWINLECLQISVLQYNNAQGEK